MKIIQKENPSLPESRHTGRRPRSAGNHPKFPIGQLMPLSVQAIQRIKQVLKRLLKAHAISCDFRMSDFCSAVNNSAQQSKPGKHLVTSASSSHAMSGQIPLSSFGLIADVHYADIDNGTNFSKTHNRYYRNSLSYVKTAVADWMRRAGTDDKISLILDLGDLIDGYNAKHKSSVSALKTVSEAFDPAGVPVIHVWGNHDLYNFTRQELHAMPQMNPVLSGLVSRPIDSSEHSMHFDVSLCPGFRLVVIDCYEVSMLGVDEKSDAYRCAEEIVRKENKNEDLNSPSGLSGDKRRFVKFNGAVSHRQLQWLDGVLRESERHGEVVLVAGHIPLCSSDLVCLCWNYLEVLKVLHQHSCVLAYFAGHAHDEIYMRDEHGIHHLGIQGVIEVPPGACAAHLNVQLYNDKVLVMDERTEAVFELKIKKT